jgi:hypothetical protein
MTQGSFDIKRGNDRVPYPVCRPKSVELIVTRIAEEGEWSEDWFTTWKSRKDNPNNLSAFDQEDNMTMTEMWNAPCEEQTSGKKIVVEIGSLFPVRIRAGERVSRVHEDYTSSLRRSRWRKKYVNGLFI